MVRSVYLGLSEALRRADDLDRQIADALMTDGRMSGRDIAHRIGVSEATVSRRLAILEDEKLLLVRGFILPAAVGCVGTSLARFVVEGDSKEAAAALARQQGFHRVARIDGGQQLTALLVAANSNSILQHIDRAIAAIPEIRLERTCEVLHILPPGSAVPDSLSRPAARVPRQADIQTKLLQAVQSNMRQSLNHVSQHIQASPSATRSNLDRLIETGAIRTVVVANPHFMGTPVITQIRIRPRAAFGESLKVVRTLLPHAWIFQCLDGENLIVECPFTSSEAAEEKSAEIRTALQEAEVSTHLLLEIHSDLLDWWCDAPCKAMRD